MDSWFDVAVFAETDKPLEGVTPLCIKKYRLRSGKQILTVRTTEKPGMVALDLFRKRIERSSPCSQSRQSHILYDLNFSFSFLRMFARLFL
jgi:hypothetical protein